MQVDAAVDLLARHARPGRGASDLILIVFAHGLPIEGEVVRTAISSTLNRFHSSLNEMADKAQARFPAPRDGFQLDPEFERAEALARWAMTQSLVSLRPFRTNLRSSGSPATPADLLQVTTELFRSLWGAADDDAYEATETTVQLMRALGMDGMLQSAAPGIAPLLSGGIDDFADAVINVGRLALQPLPDDINLESLFAARDFAIRIAPALRAIPPELARYLGGPQLATFWDPTDPASIAMTTSMLAQMHETDGPLDPTPLLPS